MGTAADLIPPRPSLSALRETAAERGRFAESHLAEHVMATVHPSSILRTKDEEREREIAALVDDLKVAAKVLS